MSLIQEISALREVSLGTCLIDVPSVLALMEPQESASCSARTEFSVFLQHCHRRSHSEHRSAERNPYEQKNQHPGHDFLENDAQMIDGSPADRPDVNFSQSAAIADVAVAVVG